ncbi:MAG TPA: LysR family transcriptional regulator [Gammaproteobacteria bacterium]|nr:LysR family transcriptional regulator [Gammaproteobacteria bacterium]
MDFDERTLRRLKLSDLRLFHAVVHWGGMAKAASHLNISQPAVSKAIAALEHTLGVRLLERHPQGVEPTLYGRALLKGGVAVFDELKQSLKEIEFLADPNGGELTIGCTEPLAAGFLAAVIDKFSEQFPRVGFNVVAADPVTLIERELAQRNIEFALAPISGLNVRTDVEVEVLFDDRQVVMAGAQSKWGRRRNLRLPDLIGEPWIWPPPTSIIGVSMTEAFRASGVELPRTRVISFSIPLCYQLLSRGRFLAMLPTSMARLAENLPLLILKVSFPAIPRPTAIITLKNRTISPLAQRFIGRIREFAKLSQ